MKACMSGADRRRLDEIAQERCREAASIAETAEVKAQMRAGHLDWERLHFALRY
jgi:hypothetical protein